MKRVLRDLGVGVLYTAGSVVVALAIFLLFVALVTPPA